MPLESLKQRNMTYLRTMLREFHCVLHYYYVFVFWQDTCQNCQIALDNMSYHFFTKVTFEFVMSPNVCLYYIKKLWKSREVDTLRPEETHVVFCAQTISEHILCVVPKPYSIC